MNRILTALLILAAPTGFAIDASEFGSAVKDKVEDLKYKVQEATSSESGGGSGEQATFREEKAFRMKGAIEKAGPKEVSIAREGLPPAVLNIREKSMILLDGQLAKPNELPRGADVDARFQLEGGQPIAVKLDAKSKGLGTGGAGKAGASEKKTDTKSSEENSKEDSNEQNSKEDSKVPKSY